MKKVKRLTSLREQILDKSTLDIFRVKYDCIILYILSSKIKIVSTRNKSREMGSKRTHLVTTKCAFLEYVLEHVSSLLNIPGATKGRNVRAS